MLTGHYKIHYLNNLNIWEQIWILYGKGIWKRYKDMKTK